MKYDEIIFTESLSKRISITLSDSLSVEENISVQLNAFAKILADTISISDELTSAYKIKRAGDTAFIRTNYP